MVDNVTADPGSGGSVFATDEISSVHYPIGKLAFGALNTAVLASAAAGNSDTGTLRVVIATDQATVQVDMLAEHARNDAFVEAVAMGGEMDDTTPVVATEGNVSPVRITANRAMHSILRGTGANPLDLNTGVRSADTLRVSICTDDVVPASQSGTWNITNVSGAVSLPTGAATSALQLAAGHTVTAIGTDTPADGDATPSVALLAQSFNMVFNGTTWDLVREGATAGSILVDGSNETQPISAASLPLPSGAATSAAQLADGHNVTVDNASIAVTIAQDVMLGTDFSDVLGTASLILATQADAVVNTADGLQVTNFNMVYNGTTWDRVREGGTAGSILVDGSAVTQPVSAATLPLPSGAATSAAQLADNHNVTIGAAIPTGANTIGEVSIGAATTAPGDLAKAEDDGHASGDVGVMALAVRNDAVATTLTNTDLDYSPIAVTSLGEVWIKTGMEAAQDAAAIDTLLQMGVEARTTLPTAVADGDAVRPMADDQGRLVTVLNSPRDLVSVGRLALTSTTRTELLAAGGASVFVDLTLLVLSNESATEVRVDIFDLTTGGTAIFSVDLAADGGGAVISLPTPHPQATANNAWDAQLSGAVSTVYITAQGVDRA